MALRVPKAIEELLREKDRDGRPLVDFEIAGSIAEIRASLQSQSPEEQSGGWAELAAFQFAPQGDDSSPWNTYFNPRGGTTFTDGSQTYVPDIGQADIEILDYWKKRVAEVTHPVLRARYADLTWDFSPYFKVKRDVTQARTAIDAYLASVERRLFVRATEAVTYLTRALGLALSIGDEVRRNSVVSAMLSFFASDAKPNHHGTWSFIFDDLLQNKRVAVTPDQEGRIISGLENILLRASTLNTDDFSPWDAQAAAERLAAYYHKHGESDEMRRVVRIYGGAFEMISAKASSMLATGWLAPVLDAYRNLGMDEDARRVQLTIAEKAKTLKSEMKTISVPLEITQAEVDEYLEVMTSGTSDECLTRIAFAFVPKAESVRDLLRKMIVRTPLLTAIGIEKSDDGFIVATAGSVTADPDGRLLLQLAQYIEGSTALLSRALERGFARHLLGAEAVSAYLYRSPLFRTERQELIGAGLAAHFAGDYVKAIHVLVPQIEEACRVLLGLLGEPKTRVKGQNKGILHQKNLNEILDEPSVQGTLREDAYLYLKAFLTEPIGLNVRNRLCHGLMSAMEFTRLLSDRVLHVMLMIAQVRTRSNVTGVSPSSSTTENALGPETE
jgi:hypothetical protein